MEYCNVCFNARVSDDYELNDDNDLSYHYVGDCAKGHGICIASGDGKPLRILFDKYEEKLGRKVDVGIYYPKFCPECGRELNEYKQMGRRTRK